MIIFGVLMSPITNNIVSQFEENVKINPEAIAVVLEGKHWSYFQLNQYANYVAKRLKESGLEAFDVIGIYGLKSFEMIAAILAVLKLKCTYMPIDQSTPELYIKRMIENSQAKCIISFWVDISHIKLNITNLDLDYNKFDNKVNSENSNL